MNNRPLIRVIGASFALTAILLLAACGGGGESTATGTAQPPTTQSPTPSDENEGEGTSTALSGRVIDGYLGGATVFVDVNWSLAHEDGEPTATTNSDGSFEFNEADLAAFPCFKERPIVAEVPKGAEDSDRGTVNSPFKLVYLPASENAALHSNTDINITPFTTLFASVVASSKTSVNAGNISVTDGCSPVAGDVAAEVSKSIGVIEDQLFAKSGLSLSTFYSDFIEGGDEEKAQAAKKLSDYFKATYKLASEVQEDFRTEYDTPAVISIYPDVNAVADILLGKLTAAMPLDIAVRAEATTTEDTGWTATELLLVQGVYLLDGQYLVDWQCGEGQTGACPYQPVQLDSLLKTAKYYRDDVDWLRTDEATGYDLHLGNVFTYRWNEDLSDYRCYLVDEFAANNPSAMAFTEGNSDPDDIKKPQFLSGEYTGGQLDAPPADCQYEDAPLVYVFRDEIFPKTTARGYWKAIVQYSFDVNALDTSRIQYLATTSLYDDRKTFDSAAAVAELQQLPWSPSQLPDMIASLQPTEWFSLSVWGDNYHAIYVTLGEKCEVYSIGADGAETLISSVTDDQAAAQEMCFGDLSQWP